MSHITLEQRYVIEALLPTSITQKNLASKLGISQSALSREVFRNQTDTYTYKALDADLFAKKRKNNRLNYKLDEALKKTIKGFLEKKHSPEQIEGSLKAAGTAWVSYETIYKWVYAEKEKGGEEYGGLYKNLRRWHKKRKKRGGAASRRGVIPGKRMIGERPPEVEAKNRFGDWEGDTIIGANHKGAILTLVDRKSKFTYMEKLDGKTAVCVENAIEKFFMSTGIPFETITFDNGTEFANHEKIAEKTYSDVYFANPYHSWERGLNENTNGLIRQYIPKKTNFDDYSHERIKEIMDEINDRPRKSLLFKSPAQFLVENKIAFET